MHATRLRGLDDPDVVREFETFMGGLIPTNDLMTIDRTVEIFEQVNAWMDDHGVTREQKRDWFERYLQSATTWLPPMPEEKLSDVLAQWAGAFGLKATIGPKKWEWIH